MWKKCSLFWCWRWRVYQIEGRWYCLKHGRPIIEAMEYQRVYGGRIYARPYDPNFPFERYLGDK